MGLKEKEDRTDRLEEENVKLRNAVEELSVLNEIATAIGSAMTLDEVVDLMVRKSVKHLKSEQAAVMLLDPAQENHPFKTMVRKAESHAGILPYRLDTQLTGWMLKNQKPLLINDLSHDNRFSPPAEAAATFHSLLSVPLLLKGRMTGLLTVFNKKTPDGYNAEDQRLLSIIAAQSAQIIENARLLEQEKMLVRMEEELRMAREIQMGLLPKEAPRLEGYDISGTSIPAKVVGGDYFDFIPLSEQRLAFCLGDVSGKGLPAALLMSNLQAAVRGMSVLGTSCCECMVRANTLLYHNTDPERFATLFYGMVDAPSHAVHCCNAGHNYPLLFSEGKTPKTLETGGIVLGFLDNVPFEETQFPMAPGDLLVVYSDGITEATNAAEEQFGETRLIETVMENRTLPASNLIDRIVKAVEKHVGKAPQTDDMTLLAIRRNV